MVVPVYGEFGQRLAEAIELAGGNVVKVFAEPGNVPRLDEVKEAIRRTDNLKAVYTVHNETSTGCAIPYIQELAKAAHEKDAFMVVDGVSSIGGYSVPVDAWGVDMCVTASQKCIAAPPGMVIISLNGKVADFLKKTPPTVRYFDLGKHLDFLEHGYTPFTPAVSLYYALEEALAELMEETLEKRVARHVRCASQLYSAIESMGLECFADKGCRSNTVIAVKCPKGVDDEQFREIMERRARRSDNRRLRPAQGEDPEAGLDGKRHERGHPEDRRRDGQDLLEARLPGRPQARRRRGRART